PAGCEVEARRPDKPSLAANRTQSGGGVRLGSYFLHQLQVVRLRRCLQTVATVARLWDFERFAHVLANMATAEAHSQTSSGRFHAPAVSQPGTGRTASRSRRLVRPASARLGSRGLAAMTVPSTPRC